MPAVNGVGEPCAGEPHARFEAAGTGNGADLAKDTGVAQPTGEPVATKAPGPTVSEPPRQSPTLHRPFVDDQYRIPVIEVTDRQADAMSRTCWSSQTARESRCCSLCGPQCPAASAIVQQL